MLRIVNEKKNIPLKENKQLAEFIYSLEKKCDNIFSNVK
jgi:hypothetical protein